MNQKTLSETAAWRMALTRIIQLTKPAPDIHVLSWTGEVLVHGAPLDEEGEQMLQRLVRLCRSLGESLASWQESAVELRVGELCGRALALDRRIIYVSVRVGAQEQGFRAQVLKLDQQRRALSPSWSQEVKG